MWFFLTLTPCTHIKMMSQIWLFPSLLSPVTQDVPTHFLVCPDFRHVRPPCLPSPLPLVHLPGWLLELTLSALISGLWYSPNHLRFSYAAITHSHGHFSRMSPDIPPLLLTRTNGPGSMFQFLQQNGRPQWCQRSQQGFRSWPWVCDTYHTPDPRSRQQQASLGPSLLTNRFFACFLSLPVQPYCFPLSKPCLGFKKNLPDLFFSFPHKIWKNFKK